MQTIVNIIAEKEIDVSVGGLIIGLLLGVLVYLVGAWAARESGHGILAVIGAVVGVIVFIVLGFEFYD